MVDHDHAPAERLDVAGIVRIGAEVKSGDILVDGVKRATLDTPQMRDAASRARSSARNCSPVVTA